jgi:hypothetical protein
VRKSEVYIGRAIRPRGKKRIALAKLATLIDGIVNPRDNVAPLRERAQ